MDHETYFHWLVSATPTTWWHDSGDPEELRLALELGASGVTTNPVLSAQALRNRPDHWRAAVAAVPAGLQGEARAEALMRVVVGETAAKVLPICERTGGQQGYVCAQVNPARAGDREGMLAQARRLHAWAPNIAVKLPATAAGLDVLEECASEGITTTITVSFTVPQVVAAGERFQRGLARGRLDGKPRPCCFAVIMIGRLDDYLREVAQDQRARVSESDISQAGLAVVKRAYQVFQECRYEAVLLVAALRGVQHMAGLAGARLIMSVHPSIQAKLLEPGLTREPNIDVPVPSDVLDRLRSMPEFVKAYERDGLQSEEFISYGVTQRTLSQFSEAGWKALETMQSL